MRLADAKPYYRLSAEDLGVTVSVIVAINEPVYQWDSTSSYHLDAEQQIVFPIDLSDSTTNFLVSLTASCQLLTLLGTDLVRGQSAMLEKIDGSDYVQTIK